MIRPKRLPAVSLLTVLGACTATVVLPNQPGGAASDVSAQADREEWLAAHPDTEEDIRAAIMEGVLVEGMTDEHREVVTNSDRRGTTGYGYWRSEDMGDEVRYRWYVANQREPFDDVRGRAVCELVYVGDRLAEIDYCTPVPSGVD